VSRERAGDVGGLGASRRPSTPVRLRLLDRQLRVDLPFDALDRGDERGRRRALVERAGWFFTVNLLDRRRRLLTDNIDALRQATRLRQTRHPFAIDAMVVLPDHIHAVWTLPPGDADFSLRWRLIKIDFAKAVPKTERRSPVRIARGERAIWQRRFWEHLIRDDEDFRRHVEYCYINPVKHP
jgi:REP-associated tyrosine transposase